VARATYELNIVTPERSVFDGSVSSTTLPGEEGYLGVWAHHAPMVAALMPGVLTVHEGSSESPTRPARGVDRQVDRRRAGPGGQGAGRGSSEGGLHG
jgi:F-type H+-transporting ATPase subunit epsilon